MSGAASNTYSARNARTTSTRAARAAGTSDPSTAAASSTVADPMSGSGPGS